MNAKDKFCYILINIGIKSYSSWTILDKIDQELTFYLKYLENKILCYSGQYRPKLLALGKLATGKAYKREISN